MVEIDWDRVLSINPVSLKDEEIEDLYPVVAECDIEEVSNLHNLKALFRVTQEILQYRDNQVESLLIECDELRERNLETKQFSPGNRKSGRKLEIMDESLIDSQRDSGYEESVQEMLREKNSKIETLMQELEGLEQENSVLKNNLTLLKDEMEDATEKMNEMTDELETLRDNFNTYKDKSERLEQENSALLTQIEELAAQQIDRDKLIDDFGAAIDARIVEWKSILDEKDTEIIQLRENLSQTLLQPLASFKEQNSPHIVSLNEEINDRDKIIAELQSKLSEAVAEINEGCSVIEKLKTDVKLTKVSERKKEQRDLLRKYQAANQRIKKLEELLETAENDARIKSEELCEALVILRKYEDQDQGLTDTLHELKEVKDQLNHKNEYIKDLVNVINKLEMLNSHQELEITTLREKLGIPDDEEVSVDHVIQRRKEEQKKIHELEYVNKVLKEENLELKSDIRTLKYKFKKLATKFVGQSGLSIKSDTVDNPVGSAMSLSKSDDAWTAEREKEWLSDKIELSKIKENVQLVIEENEALRKGMHEILDSIRNQDAKSTVEIQSDTLERLLEALDVRHLAGWYHPAMRLQERLNVVQGINSELRTQLKELRKEVKAKDVLLHRAGVGITSAEERSNVEGSETEESKVNISEVEKLQEAYRNDLEEWQKQTNSLKQESTDLKDMIIKLELKVQEYENNWKVLDLSEDDIRNALAFKSQEYVEATVELSMSNRKCSMLKELLSKESTKLYHLQKETIRTERNMKKYLVDSEKRTKLLENQVAMLQSNLMNSISVLQYNELNEKYVESSIRLRAALEDRVLQRANNQAIADEEHEQPEKLELQASKLDDNDSNQLAEFKIKLLEEQQRADRLSQLHDKSRKQLTQIEIDLSRATALNSELRDQLIQLHQIVTNEMKSQNVQQSNVEEILREYQSRIDTLQLENRNLKQVNDVSKEEAQMLYSINSLKTIELDSLRHQVLDLQAVSEDKETIARLGFELTNCRSLETELRKKKELLENDLTELREEMEESKKSIDEMRKQMQQCREQCNNRCKSYIEMIRFLQQQYAGSTSATAWERYELNLTKLMSDRLELSKKIQEANEEREKVKLQHEILSSRLQIVERLKDMLEQQIGSPDVQSIMQRFSEDSQRTLSDMKYKRQISHFEYELQIANRKLLEYEATVTSMEVEMLNMQKVWKEKLEREKEIMAQVEPERLSPEQDKEIPEKQIQEVEKPDRDLEIRKRVDIENMKADQKKDIELKEGIVHKKEIISNSTQTEIINSSSVEVQCVFNLCYTETNAAKKTKENNVVQNKQEIEEDESFNACFKEQLNKALTLASERSAMILRLESQLAEFQTKINSLTAANEEKDTKLVDRDKIIEQLKSDSNISNVDGSDKLALKSSINTLQKLVNQKEETVSRYQILLKENRDEHSRAANSLQEEIKHLQDKIAKMEKGTEEKQVYEFPEHDEPEKQDSAKENLNKDFDSSVDTARLQEQISMLEADLKAAKGLGQRWHRLAEDRLSHIDDMRSRLEEQHKLELESYRLELHKWQCETVSLRQQLSENRMQLAKDNIAMTKDLQEKDNKIQELSIVCQRLENELEFMETVANAKHGMTYDVREPKMCETVHNSGREQSINQSQSQLDCLRRQLQTLLDKERMYKNQIADLKQQQSRRYMATKTQEKKTSQREIQLDRKVKSLEEELQKKKEQLDKESLVHEVKKAKTAEELALWEKQKKWQQTAEKLKEKLKEKTEELQKLQTNHEKLRSVVSCMEREKWYLRSKLKLEKSGMSSGYAFYPPVSTADLNIVEDMQKECDLLKSRVNELTERLANEDNDELRNIIEDQKSRISALESVAEGNAYVISQLEKLESIKHGLEKTNSRLETENFELRLELEKTTMDIPSLRQKIEHLEKYVEILKVEKLSESIPTSSERLLQHPSSKKTIPELEKTIFVLKRIVEKLQAENKRLKAKNSHRLTQMGKSTNRDTDSTLKKQCELAKQRVVSLETDLQLAEQKIATLENSQKLFYDNNGEVSELKQQLAHKSELLDRVKFLLTRAAINEKALRRQVQQLEMRQTLSTIPECYVTPPDTT